MDNKLKMGLTAAAAFVAGVVTPITAFAVRESNPATALGEFDCSQPGPNNGAATVNTVFNKFGMPLVHVLKFYDENGDVGIEGGYDAATTSRATVVKKAESFCHRPQPKA